MSQPSGWEVHDVITRPDQPFCCVRSGRATVAGVGGTSNGWWGWARCGLHWPGELARTRSCLVAVLTAQGWVVDDDTPPRWPPDIPGQRWIHHPQVDRDRLWDLALGQTSAELHRLGVEAPDVQMPRRWTFDPPLGHPLVWLTCVLLADHPQVAAMLVEQLPAYEVERLERTFPEFASARRSGPA